MRARRMAANERFQKMPLVQRNPKKKKRLEKKRLLWVRRIRGRCDNCPWPLKEAPWQWQFDVVHLTDGSILEWRGVQHIVVGSCGRDYRDMGVVLVSQEKWDENGEAALQQSAFRMVCFNQLREEGMRANNPPFVPPRQSRFWRRCRAQMVLDDVSEAGDVSEDDD